MGGRGSGGSGSWRTTAERRRCGSCQREYPVRPNGELLAHFPCSPGITKRPGTAPSPPLDRARALTRRDPATGCLMWTGYMAESCPYPLLKYGTARNPATGAGRRTYSVRRLLYEAKHGPQPAHVMVRNTCGVKRCVEPRHATLG